jgi:ABC-type multidrug transport system fused ATPase/permease subunit
MVHNDNLIILKRLFLLLNRRRKFQLSVLLFMMILSSFAEIFSIGMVLPFLTVLTSNELLIENNLLKIFSTHLNIANKNDFLFSFALIFISAIIFSTILRMITLWLTTKLSYVLGADLGLEVFKRVIFQPYEYHISNNSSEIINGITSQTESLITSLLRPLLLSILSIFTLFVSFLILFFIQTSLSFFIIIFFGLFYYLITRKFKDKLNKNSHLITENRNNRLKLIQETLAGIREIIINSTQKIFLLKFHVLDVNLRRSQSQNSFIGESPRLIIESFGIILITLIAVIFTMNDSGSENILPILGMIALGAQRLLPMMQQIYVSLTIFQGSKKSIQDALNFLEKPLPVYLNDNTQYDICFNKNILIKNLSFKYNNKKIISNFNLEIIKGNRIGIIGKTGSGKSTLVDLIMGLLIPQSGKILIDDVELDLNNIYSWRTKIAHVPQNIFLSDSSIFENIAFGIPFNKIDRDRVYYAAKAAVIYDTINELPDGFNTITGERGIKLSGGQKQRIVIARALYKKCSILILDESTSALDNITEEEVMNSLKNLNPDLTTIIIAHRLSTLNYCDKIIEI